MRVATGGSPIVADQIVRGLDRSRYEPAIIFYTYERSHIREELLQSDIKSITLNEHCVNEPSIFNKARKRKRRHIGSWIKSHFGENICQVYLSFKDFIEFVPQGLREVWLFKRTIRNHRIDLLHSHTDVHYGKPECIAAWLSGIPCIIHNHRYEKFNYFDKFLLLSVNQFIHISSSVAEDHISNGTPSQKGNIIHNGIEISPYIKKYDTDLVRSDIQVKQDEILVGLIGRIDWWKGHDYFIEAIALAAKTIPTLKGLIVGEVWNDQTGRNHQYLNRLRLLIRSLDIDDKITFTGFRSDIPRLISALDIVVLASSEPEPFGLVIIEGMAAGKPLIATAAGGVIDIIEDGVNGLLIPCKDPNAMAQAILKIISNPAWARQMGLAARRRVAERFTVQKQVKAVQKLYDSIFNVP